MPLLSSLIEAAGLAALFTLVLLRWKSESRCLVRHLADEETIHARNLLEGVVSEIADPLTIEVRELLYAFELAAAHVKKGGTYATRLAEQQELALGLIDWAICESDRGVDLLKEMTKPDEIARQ